MLYFGLNFAIPSRFKLPPDLVEYDLHVALEEPTVFDFRVKVAGWSVPSATK